MSERRPRAAGSPTADGSGPAGGGAEPPGVAVSPSAATGLSSSTERASASPIAVPCPKLASPSSSPSSTSLRSCVSGAATYGSDEKVTRPTRYLPGSPVEEAPHRLLRGPEPRRLDVVGGHRARDVDGEGDRGLLARDRRPHLRPGERCQGAHQRHERQRRRERVSPVRAAGRDRGQHLDVRVVDGVARPAPLDQRDTRAPRAARAGARAAREAIRSSPGALRLNLHRRATTSGSRPRRVALTRIAPPRRDVHDAHGGELRARSARRPCRGRRCGCCAGGARPGGRSSFVRASVPALDTKRPDAQS